MVAQAELTIQREFQGARNRLQAELVDIAAQKAQEIIVEEMKEKDQDRLVQEFIERVEKLN
jgi:F0F1-type ATP synthase membrane subunit b/b'